jgi:cyclopropane-fatty-acyl-phospholipid synthase
MSNEIPEKYGASADPIEFHYDTGSDYFSLWLGEAMTDSSALWDDDNENQSLDDVLLEKIRHHIEQSRAPDKENVLDIGCGWSRILLPWRIFLI